VASLHHHVDAAAIAAAMRGAFEAAHEVTLQI
jgi:hypothetical protein